MKKAAGEGQVHLDAQLQAEWYKIQEEAKSKTSKLRTDHEALKATQARHPTLASVLSGHGSDAKGLHPAIRLIAVSCAGCMDHIGCMRTLTNNLMHKQCNNI